MKNIQKKRRQSKLLCFLCNLSNIQKCNFKECPLTWVAPLTMILPICEVLWHQPQELTIGFILIGGLFDGVLLIQSWALGPIFA